MIVRPDGEVHRHFHERVLPAGGGSPGLTILIFSADLNHKGSSHEPISLIILLELSSMYDGEHPASGKKQIVTSMRLYIIKITYVMKEKTVISIGSVIRTSVFIFFLLALHLISSASFAQTTWVAPKDADNVKNPLVGNGAVLADARTLYVANCGPCHGGKGKGDGPAAPGLNPKPADHTSASVQSESDGSLYWKLSEGRSPMPGYKKIFSDQQRWELITFIRTLAKSPKK
jgi:mono/diheme cytochrome c family protein